MVCPFCGFSGNTLVKKNKCDVVCAGLIITLKILLAILLSVFVILLIIACMIITSTSDYGSDN